MQFTDTAYLDMNPKTGRKLSGYIAVFIKPVNSLPTGLQNWFNGKLNQQGAAVGTVDQHDS